MKDIYGAIMGDVINSSNFPSLEKLTEYLEKFIIKFIEEMLLPL